jgi:integrase
MLDFVERKFAHEHVARKTVSGQTHYKAMLKHVLTPEEVSLVFSGGTDAARTKLKALPNWPYMSKMRLCDIKPDDVQRLMSAALAQGYSWQTAAHIRNVISAIFEHARKERFADENPAALVTLPGVLRKEKHVMTLAQVNQVLGLMQYPEKEMALFALLTSMNMGEICGLQWKRVNLTEEWSTADGEPIPPGSFAIRKQWCRGELNDIGVKSRQRNVPIPEPLVPILLELSRRRTAISHDDFVLASRGGTPIRVDNILERRLKAIGKELEMPWLSWQVLRHAHRTLTYELGNTHLAKGVAAL